MNIKLLFYLGFDCIASNVTSEETSKLIDAAKTALTFLKMPSHTPNIEPMTYR